MNNLKGKLLNLRPYFIVLFLLNILLNIYWIYILIYCSKYNLIKKYLFFENYSRKNFVCLINCVYFFVY